ncbi:hypothetical protein ACTJKQ_24455 [Acidovorax sp. 22279]|uniref:hypothetical protein n=1 Tax=Acidovorax sp. 22279 TaxID=3453900 RepID=UPI003F84B074
MVHLYRIICAALLCVIGVSASAAIQPVVRYKYYTFEGTASEIVAQAQANQPTMSCGGGVTKTLNWYSKNATASGVDIWHSRDACPGYGPYDAYQFSAGAIGTGCPANSSLSGGSCTCNASYIEINGACEAKNDDRDRCASFAVSQTLPGGALVQDYRLQGNVADGAQFCMPGAFDSPSKGCKVSFSRDAFLDYGGGASVTEGTFSMASNSSSVDQSCSVGDNTTPPKVPQKEKCPDGYTGTVNGVERCINKVPDSGVGNNSEEETTDTETETRRVTRNSTTECKNGVCTTTTTTTTTVTTKPGGATSTSTSTTVTSGSQAGFCKENPGTKICSNGDEKGVGDVGSVTGGKTHGQPTLYETKYPNGIKGVWEDSGIAGADGKFGQLASALMPSIADGNGGCLSFTVPLSVGIVDFGVLDVSPPCLIWPFIRICVLITALWLARALIFGG